MCLKGSGLDKSIEDGVRQGIVCQGVIYGFLFQCVPSVSSKWSDGLLLRPSPGRRQSELKDRAYTLLIDVGAWLSPCVGVSQQSLTSTVWYSRSPSRLIMPLVPLLSALLQT